MKRNDQMMQTMGPGNKSPTQPSELFQLSIKGIKINLHGRALLILALGIAAAMGVVVVVKMSL